jgi:hypothetical protein
VLTTRPENIPLSNVGLDDQQPVGYRGEKSAGEFNSKRLETAE